jgi:agmatinase
LNDLRYLGSQYSLVNPDVVLVGVPYDGTVTFRPGARFAPAAVRIWSDVLETYCPVFKRDLTDVKLLDAGDLPSQAADWGSMADSVRATVSDVLSRGASSILIGGEHSITLPAVEAYAEYHDDLAVVQMDAHLDLRDDYNGNRFSHATVMRRILEKTGPDSLFQFGARSGIRQEWDLAESEKTIVTDLRTLCARLRGRPIYLSIDLDVLDPSVMPETGTPEPGGMSFTEIHQTIFAMRELEIVGGDVVEYSPVPGGGGPSGAVAAKVIRELIFLTAGEK